MKSDQRSPIRLHRLDLTDLELIHLRDLLSVSLPTSMQVTVSQQLATAADRPLTETKLWNKVTRACRGGEIPLDDEAPDFIVGPTSIPEMGVFQVASSLPPPPEPPGTVPDEQSVDLFKTPNEDE